MSLRIFILTFLYLLIAASQQLHAQAEETNLYADALREAFPADDGPGAAAIVVRKGEVLFHDAVGMADLEHDVKLRPDHIFRIGSITKQFTAASILQLAEKGKLSLDDEITKFLPDFPTQGKKITVHHLLNHTSGIKSYTGLEKWDREARKRDFTPSEMVDYFKDEPMDFTPGEAFRYNNSGYFLLGYIIEKVTGGTYEAYVEENLFAPLGMQDSRYGNAEEIVPGRAEGYSNGPTGDLQNADYLSMTQPHGAGSLLSTVKDLSIWYQAVKDGKVISKESLKKALSPTELNGGKKEAYGYGWSLGDIKGSKQFGHGGGINGFLTASLYLPEEEVFVAVFSNCNCQDPGGVARKMAEIAIGKYEPIVAIEVDAAQLDRYRGKYQLMPEFFVTMTHNGKVLTAQATGQGSFPLTPTEPHVFVHEGAGVKVRFNPDADGSVPSFTLFQGGAEREAKRVD